MPTLAIKPREQCKRDELSLGEFLVHVELGEAVARAAREAPGARIRR